LVGLDAEHRTQGRVVREALGESIGILWAFRPQDHPLADQPQTNPSFITRIARERGHHRSVIAERSCAFTIVKVQILGRIVLNTHVLRVEAWANRKGSLNVAARLGHVALGKASLTVRSLGHGPRVRTHKLGIRLTAAGLRALRAHPHGTITATAVTRDRKGRHARITAKARLGA